MDIILELQGADSTGDCSIAIGTFDVGIRSLRIKKDADISSTEVV